MKRADIYIKTDSSSQKATERWYGYVLEFKHNGETRTREGFGTVTATYHQAILTALIEAIERFREECEIHIHTEDVFILNMMEQNLETWAENGFRTAKGKAVANQEEWIRVWQQSKRHLILAEPGEHEYSGWLLSEIKTKKERE